MNLHAYSINAITTILPLEEMKKCPKAVMFAKSYTVESENAEAFDRYLKYYTEEENTSMGYLIQRSSESRLFRHD